MSLALIMAVAISVPTAPAGAVSFRTIAKGTDSRFRTHQEVVVRRATLWHLLWYEHSGAQEPPAVDFRREMVIAIFSGRGAVGDSVEIVSVAREGDFVVVRYREHATAGARVVNAPASITPFHIVAVPADRAVVKFVALTPS
jgi:hypothetical protein